MRVEVTRLPDTPKMYHVFCWTEGCGWEYEGSDRSKIKAHMEMTGHSVTVHVSTSEAWEVR